MYSSMFGLMIALGIGWAGAPTAWHNDYAAARAEACSSDKPLFIIICPGSCDYARMMDLGTFVGDRVEEALRADYVRLTLDTDTPEGLELASKFEVKEGPHFVIIDRSGRWQVYYRSGILTEADLAPVLARFRRSKLTASGKPVVSAAQGRRVPVQLCST